MTEPVPGRAAAWVTGVLLATGTALAWRTTQERSILGNHDRLLLEILLLWVVWALALTALRRTSARTGIVLVLVGTAALRLAALSPVVPLSDDLYRYAWDGQVQAAGIDPYRYAPTAPELESLRTEWLWPAERCPAGDGTDCSRLNRETVRTIYPPVAQAWFLVGHLAGASHLRDLGWELLGLVADLATVALLWRVLRARGRDPRWVAAYAWSPVAVLEAVQNGHVDGLATFFVVAAVALAGRRPAWSGAALGVAAMVKLYPALLLPALLTKRPLRVVSAFTGVCAFSYLPHLLALGGDVLGYLPGYLAEEDYGSGGRYALLRPFQLPAALGSLLAVGAGLAVAVLVLRRRRTADPAAAALLLLGAALLIASPVQPWYGLPLAALATLTGRLAWFAVPALTYPVFFAVVPGGASTGAARTGTACFALALVVVVLAWRRRTAERPASETLTGLPRTGTTSC